MMVQTLREVPFQLHDYRPVALPDLVRLGRAHDGGYVLPARCVDESSRLVAFGISGDWSFESAFLERNGSARALALDASVSSRGFRHAGRSAFVRGARLLATLKVRAAREAVSEAREYHRMARDLDRVFDGRRAVFLPRFILRSTTPDAVGWADLREHPLLAGQSGLFVKMDVEGDEYEVLPEMRGDFARLTGMVIEFHDLADRWSSFVDLMALLGRHFAVAHVHGNNYRPLIPGTSTPSVLEISLVNRDLLDGTPTRSTHAYPIPGLDMPNDRSKPDYPLFG